MGRSSQKLVKSCDFFWETPFYTWVLKNGKNRWNYGGFPANHGPNWAIQFTLSNGMVWNHGILNDLPFSWE